MRHILFGSSSDTVTSAVLIKDSSMMHTELMKHYINPISKNVPMDDICAFSLKYDPSGKVSASVAKDYLANSLLPAVNSLGITTLLIADSGYFKYLTGVKKVEPHYGYILPCIIKGFEHISCILSVNYGALFYNPDLQFKLTMSLDTLSNHISGSHIDAGLDIIHEAKYYPVNTVDMLRSLSDLESHPVLTCDIETTGLRFNDAEIYTIAFAWDKHHGIAMRVGPSIIGLLKQFFLNYTGTFWFHNALFDVKFLIYHLFMRSDTDYAGMREGLDVFAGVQDTMLYTYLALNSTAEVKLGLKPNSFEFTGNYAVEDLHDVTTIPLDDLLQYNLIDCLATWFVKEKYEPIVISDKQMEVYTQILQPSIKPLLEMMLMGLPLDLTKTVEAQLKLEAVRDINMRILLASPIIKKVEFQLRAQAMRDANAKLKKKVRSIDSFSDVKFNVASPDQKAYLLYEYMKLPIIDRTKTKLPATGQKVLRKLVGHTTNPEYIILLEAMIELSQSTKILNDFIANFQTLYFRRSDDTTWLNGDQVLGGTQSGRLSARNPNLANLPSNSIYGKTIKSCFVAPAGWLFGGADFNALEDRIGAILSKDEMKTAEFTQGMDGHSIRAMAFFSQLDEPMYIKTTLIDPEVVRSYDMTPEGSLKFKKEQEAIRQEAKAPSFALQYGGTWSTLHKNIGLPVPIAKAVEIGYHKLYGGLATFAALNTTFASKHGYVECAFGLRLRTPLLSQCIMGTSKTPREAESEARSAGNAITQSWGMLSNRAAIAIQKRIEESPYRLDIFLVNQIHDAIYFVWRNDPMITHWVDQVVVEEMSWQEHPTIMSDDVKLGAELDVGYSWDSMVTIKNDATLEDITEILKGL